MRLDTACALLRHVTEASCCDLLTALTRELADLGPAQEDAPHGEAPHAPEPGPRADAHHGPEPVPCADAHHRPEPVPRADAHPGPEPVPRADALLCPELVPRDDALHRTEPVLRADADALLGHLDKRCAEAERELLDSAILDAREMGHVGPLPLSLLKKIKQSVAALRDETAARVTTGRTRSVSISAKVGQMQPSEIKHRPTTKNKRPLSRTKKKEK